MLTCTWLTISIAVIILNKHILAIMACPYPLTLAFSHMLSGGAMSQLWIRLRQRKAWGWNQRSFHFLCIGLLLALNLSLSNVAFVHLSVPLIQMLKAATPVSIYLIGLISGTEMYLHARAFNVVVICIGVFLSAHGSVEYNFIGIAGQLAAVIADSVRCVLLQREMQNGPSDPLEALASFAPVAAIALALPSVVEWKESHSTCSRHAKALIGVSCALVFALNIVVCQLIRATSALTTSLTGIIKEWVS